MTENERIHIALVGHCGPDAFALQSAVMGAIPDATLHRLNSYAELRTRTHELTLLLVNRVLDGIFENNSGIELIAELLGELGEQAPAMMLISNYPEAIEESVAVGALPGFGKRAMRSPQTERALRAAVGRN